MYKEFLTSRALYFIRLSDPCKPGEGQEISKENMMISSCASVVNMDIPMYFLNGKGLIHHKHSCLRTMILWPVQVLNGVNSNKLGAIINCFFS